MIIKNLLTILSRHLFATVLILMLFSFLVTFIACGDDPDETSSSSPSFDNDDSTSSSSSGPLATLVSGTISISDILIQLQGGEDFASLREATPPTSVVFGEAPVIKFIFDNEITVTDSSEDSETQALDLTTSLLPTGFVRISVNGERVSLESVSISSSNTVSATLPEALEYDTEYMIGFEKRSIVQLPELNTFLNVFGEPSTNVSLPFRTADAMEKSSAEVMLAYSTNIYVSVANQLANVSEYTPLKVVFSENIILNNDANDIVITSDGGTTHQLSANGSNLSIENNNTLVIHLKNAFQNSRLNDNTRYTVTLPKKLVFNSAEDNYSKADVIEFTTIDSMEKSSAKVMLAYSTNIYVNVANQLANVSEYTPLKVVFSESIVLNSDANDVVITSDGGTTLLLPASGVNLSIENNNTLVIHLKNAFQNSKLNENTRYTVILPRKLIFNSAKNNHSKADVIEFTTTETGAIANVKKIEIIIAKTNEHLPQNDNDGYRHIERVMAWSDTGNIAYWDNRVNTTVNNNGGSEGSAILPTVSNENLISPITAQVERLNLDGSSVQGTVPNGPPIAILQQGSYIDATKTNDLTPGANGGNNDHLSRASTTPVYPIANSGGSQGYTFIITMNNSATIKEFFLREWVPFTSGCSRTASSTGAFFDQNGQNRFNPSSGCDTHGDNARGFWITFFSEDGDVLYRYNTGYSDAVHSVEWLVQLPIEAGKNR